MIKHLTRTGNSGARQADPRGGAVDPERPVEVSTNGRVIVISPVRAKRDVEKFLRGEALMHEKLAGAFRRLAR